MSILEAFGYAALLLLVLAFAMKTIIALRTFAIVGSLAIVLYGAFAPHIPILAIGVVMTLVNLWRRAEMRRLVGAVRVASGTPLTVDWLLPYMRSVDIPAGHVLFSKGDKAEAMYFLSSGKVRIDDLDVELGKGSMFGEVGIFSADHRRTATARCVEPCSLLVITAEKVRELYYQNPRFGFYLVGLVTARLTHNAREIRQNPSASIV
jgi:hypothetical protein